MEELKMYGLYWLKTEGEIDWQPVRLVGRFSMTPPGKPQKKVCQFHTLNKKGAISHDWGSFELVELIPPE